MFLEISDSGRCLEWSLCERYFNKQLLLPPVATGVAKSTGTEILRNITLKMLTSHLQYHAERGCCQMYFLDEHLMGILRRWEWCNNSDLFEYRNLIRFAATVYLTSLALNHLGRRKGASLSIATEISSLFIHKQYLNMGPIHTPSKISKETVILKCTIVNDKVSRPNAQ